MHNLVLKQIHWALFWTQFLPMKLTSSRLQIRCLQKPGRRVEEWVCQVGQWWAGKPPAAVAVGRWPLPPQQRFKKHLWVIKIDLWTIMSLWVSDVLSWTCTWEKFGETYWECGENSLFSEISYSSHCRASAQLCEVAPGKGSGFLASSCWAVIGGWETEKLRSYFAAQKLQATNRGTFLMQVHCPGIYFLS